MYLLPTVGMSKMLVQVANRPQQMLQSVQCFGLQCLFRHVCPVTWGKYMFKIKCLINDRSGIILGKSKNHIFKITFANFSFKRIKYNYVCHNIYEKAYFLTCASNEDSNQLAHHRNISEGMSSEVAAHIFILPYST